MDNTLEDCPRCRGTGEGDAGGQCNYPGCKHGQIDNRPKDIDYEDYEGRSGRNRCMVHD